MKLVCLIFISIFLFEVTNFAFAASISGLSYFILFKRDEFLFKKKKNWFFIAEPGTSAAKEHYPGMDERGPICCIVGFVFPPCLLACPLPIP